MKTFKTIIKQLINSLSFWKGTKPNKMNQGTVKFFNRAKGFGFIKDINGQEVYVHVRALKDSIRENDQVTYYIEEGKKGFSAINVCLA
jgi:CspA family cold shock protein